MSTKVSLETVGISNSGYVYWNRGAAALYEEAIRRHKGVIADSGPLVCLTGEHTGRAPNDRFLVREPSSENNAWWGSVNRPITPQQFSALRQAVLASLDGRELFVQDCYAGADPAYRLPIRIITERAWHSLFARTMSRSLAAGSASDRHVPEFTILHVPSMEADPAVHGTNSSAFIVLNFTERLILIGGTHYAGEIKKSIFSVMNYLLPLCGVLPMHCAANVGSKGDAALFFGLSGTCKTTLSSVPDRRLIGDDEHGWSDRGVFNFEGGCYAKMIRLSAEAEPEIYATTRRFGAVVENVVLDPNTRALNLDDNRPTENTRGGYPSSFIDNSVALGQGGHPKTLIMLTADAFGVLPPVARLSPAGAMYDFLSGYTAKVAGTERGVTDPKARFSTCFSAPFMVWHPTVYARLLGARLDQHQSNVWLVNTGWTGGPCGVGRRISIGHTRAIVDAAVSGHLDEVKYRRDPVFGLDVPATCPNVPTDILDPRETWSRDTDYDSQSRALAEMFTENFRAFESEADAEVTGARPRP